MAETIVAVVLSGWLIFLAGIASAACAWADQWVERHAWRNVDTWGTDGN